MIFVVNLKQQHMTAQFGETLKYNGVNYYLATEPLEPYLEKHNIKFYAWCTACWRGYWTIFFNSSLTVSITALFLIRILSFIFINTFFMLFLILVTNWIPFRNKVSNKVLPIYPLSAHSFPFILFRNEPCFKGSCHPHQLM